MLWYHLSVKIAHHSKIFYIYRYLLYILAYYMSYLSGLCTGHSDMLLQYTCVCIPIRVILANAPCLYTLKDVCLTWVTYYWLMMPFEIKFTILLGCIGFPSLAVRLWGLHNTDTSTDVYKVMHSPYFVLYTIN